MCIKKLAQELEKTCKNIWMVTQMCVPLQQKTIVIIIIDLN